MTVLDKSPVRILRELSRYLSQRFGQSGNMDDLQKVIQACKEVVTASPTDHPDRTSLVDLSANHFAGFEQLGNLEDQGR